MCGVVCSRGSSQHGNGLWKRKALRTRGGGAGQGRTLPRMIDELDSTVKNGQSERAGFSHTYRPSICHISDRTVMPSNGSAPGRPVATCLTSYHTPGCLQRVVPHGG